MEVLHTSRVIHRDIKPENLIFDEHGYLHLTEFGSAKFIKENRVKGRCGTPQYMAPEVLNKQSYGWAVDYYSIGVIVYELMMNCRPYAGNTKSEIQE